MKSRSPSNPWRHGFSRAALLLALLAVPASSFFGEPLSGEDALTTEQVLARASEALGGDAAWARIETLEVKGLHTSFSVIKDCTLLKKRPRLWRFEHNDTEYRALHAFDGQEGWWQKEIVIQSQGANWPQIAPLTFQRAFAAEAEFDPPLIGWREKGHVFEYLGRRELDLEPYLELELSRGDIPGAEERWLLDPQTFLPAVRISEGAYLPGQRWEQRTFFSDYRQVAGVMIPHAIEIDIGNDLRAMNVREVHVNVPLDDALFRMPLPRGMERLQFLAGDWQVQVETQIVPMKVSFSSEGESHIRADFAGALLTEDLEFISLDVPWKVRTEITWDRFREVYSFASFDNFSHHLDIHQGLFEDGMLVASNLETGTPWVTYGQAQHSRDVLSELKQDSFLRVREISLDGGATWIPLMRFHYVRR